MTLMPDITLRPGVVPEVQLHHRLRIALEQAGLGNGQLAQALAVHRNTVTNWIHGHIAPRRADVFAIAQITGVDTEWLLTGIPGPGAGPEGGVRNRCSAPLLLAA